MNDIYETFYGESFTELLKNNKKKLIELDNKFFSMNFNPRFKGTTLKRFVDTTLNKLNTMFEYNLDDIHFEIDKLNRHRFTKGFFTIVDVFHNGEWWILDSNLGGPLDEFYEPTKILINNPALGVSGEYEVGKDGFIIWNDSSHQGLLPIILKYGGFITETELTLFDNLIVSRLPVLHIAQNDEVLEQLQEFYKNLENGSLGSIVDEQLFENMSKSRSVPNISNNQDFMYLTELHTFFYSLMYNEIGIDANKTLKRESLASSEVGVNSQAIYPPADDMLLMTKQGFKKFNEATGKNISVEFGSSWLVNHDENKNMKNDFEEKEGGDNDESGDSIPQQDIQESGTNNLEQ